MTRAVRAGNVSVSPTLLVCYTPAVTARFAIDPSTGRVRFPDLPLEFSPQMAEAEFIAATAHLNRENLGAQGSWQRYAIKAPISGNRKLGTYFIFWNGRLCKASFAWAGQESWDTWSEETEAARRTEYKSQLDSQLSGNWSRAWGKVSIVVDSKGGGTDIWIDYGCPSS